VIYASKGCQDHGANRTQAGSLGYFDAVGSSLQVHGSTPGML